MMGYRPGNLAVPLRTVAGILNTLRAHGVLYVINLLLYRSWAYGLVSVVVGVLLQLLLTIPVLMYPYVTNTASKICYVVCLSAISVTIYVMLWRAVRFYMIAIAFVAVLIWAFSDWARMFKLPQPPLLGLKCKHTYRIRTTTVLLCFAISNVVALLLALGRKGEPLPYGRFATMVSHLLLAFVISPRVLEQCLSAYAPVASATDIPYILPDTTLLDGVTRIPTLRTYKPQEDVAAMQRLINREPEDQEDYRPQEFTRKYINSLSQKQYNGVFLYKEDQEDMDKLSYLKHHNKQYLQDAELKEQTIREEVNFREELLLRLYSGLRDTLGSEHYLVNVQYVHPLVYRLALVSNDRLERFTLEHFNIHNGDLVKKEYDKTELQSILTDLSLDLIDTAIQLYTFFDEQVARDGEQMFLNDVKLAINAVNSINAGPKQHRHRQAREMYDAGQNYDHFSTIGMNYNITVNTETMSEPSYVYMVEKKEKRNKLIDWVEACVTMANNWLLRMRLLRRKVLTFSFLDAPLKLTLFLDLEYLQLILKQQKHFTDKRLNDTLLSVFRALHAAVALAYKTNNTLMSLPQASLLGRTCSLLDVRLRIVYELLEDVCK